MQEAKAEFVLLSEHFGGDITNCILTRQGFDSDPIFSGSPDFRYGVYPAVYSVEALRKRILMK